MAEAEKKLIELFAALPEAVQRQVLARCEGAKMALDVVQGEADEKKTA